MGHAMKILSISAALAAGTVPAVGTLAASSQSAPRDYRDDTRGAPGGREGQPGIPFSGARPDADNQAVLDALMARGMKPYHTLTPAEARLQPSFADGVRDVLRRNGRPVAPPPGVTASDISVRGAAGPLHAKLYTPARAERAAPVILYFHGGGWVVADSNVYDSSARALARETGALVVSVDYRRAPEAKFPAQHDDALASYRWLLANAARIGGDPRRIALAGESAGGNLAVATAIAARDARLPLPVHVLSIYPVAGSDLNTPSYQENANALPLNRAGMGWFVYHTTRAPADALDPRIDLVKADLRDLPPVTIVQAQIDPLRSDGTMLAERLRAARVDVDSRTFDGVTHEFFGGDAVIAEAKDAQAYAGGRLRDAFDRRR